jgi:glutaredoxin 2
MALGFLGKSYESVVLPYNDEKTPLTLTNKKMLPIFTLNAKDGSINESLDIIRHLDPDDSLQTEQSISQYSTLEILLSEIGKDVHSLAMPYWIWTPEFNDDSRKYFTDKKEIKRGPFQALVNSSELYITQLNRTLSKIEMNLVPFYNSDVITLDDILIASHLWGMYVVPEFQFSNKVHDYLQEVSKACSFNYHEDYWRN